VNLTADLIETLRFFGTLRDPREEEQEKGSRLERRLKPCLRASSASSPLSLDEVGVMAVLTDTDLTVLFLLLIVEMSAPP
jgi:hypothetical protein